MPGKSWLLLLSADMQMGRLALVGERPEAPKQPQSIQQAMRKHLLGARLVEARAQAGLWLLWRNNSGGFWLWANWRQGYLALGKEGGNWLSFSVRPTDGLKVGMPCVLPPFEEDARPSRLVLLPGEFPALHAAAALWEEKAKAEEEKAQLKPLQTQLARLQKTMVKVRAEVERLPRVQQLQAEAEALAQNMAQLKRGTTSVSLEVFRPDGAVETRVLVLNPAKTPREEMEARFHQAKRLRRGMEIAKARLQQLEAEAEALRKQIESGVVAAPEAKPEARQAAPAPRAKPAKGQAYRAYVSADGQAIWVGRGAKHNEALSFQLAKPWHLWLHARGQSGAHVLIPLNRNEVAKPETLIDAAQLAWYFSDGREAPVGEVSYVQARYLKKAKGKAGAVLLTQEKTLRLRVEKARLNRLLSRPVAE
jgi:predicted ribosome quality control (RQC) complex YloA/Tae2 family protein